ncbi:MAG: alpha-ketoglutarate-dependent dioxygenase AlkB [Acidimicrobiia bacterium]|nr:alpha-ketoglutarate-dependent dioxygenase AlkB [Acidimicrobiia bacterium]
MAPLQLTLSASDDPVLADGPTVERRWLDATSWVDVVRGYLVGADTLFAELRDAVAWTQGRRIMFDAMVDDPRLSRWFRRDDDPHPTLTVVRADLERRYRRRLGGVGLNYYRDGHDSVAPHRDRELRRLDDTLVAILTLGAKRPFLVRPHGGGPSVDVHPASGDLLVMGGACQRDWEHGVPKRRSSGPRISASWRWSAGT